MFLEYQKFKVSYNRRYCSIIMRDLYLQDKRLTNIFNLPVVVVFFFGSIFVAFFFAVGGNAVGAVGRLVWLEQLPGTGLLVSAAFLGSIIK